MSRCQRQGQPPLHQRLRYNHWSWPRSPN